MYCSHCGNGLTGNERFCPKCGFKVLSEEIATTTKSPVASTIPDESSENISSTAISQIRPWVRYFARMLDMCLLLSVFWIICLIIELRIQLYASFVFFMILRVIWLFVEPVFLSQWGATPGKLLLRTRVTHQNGVFLTYNEALRRSVNVWFRGEGLSIPVVSLVTIIIAYNRITKNGITTWDKAESFLVKHSRIGAARIMVFIVVMLIIMAIGGIAGKLIGQSAFGPSKMAPQLVEVEVMKGLAIAVQQINDQGPTMLDENTRLDRASVGPGLRITYHHTLLHYSSQEIDAGALRDNLSAIRNRVCSNKDMAPNLKHGATYVYSYSGNDGVRITSLDVRQSDCSQ
jgi:uncharacterized RDD family membrane protein YckC